MDEEQRMQKLFEEFMKSELDKVYQVEVIDSMFVVRNTETNAIQSSHVSYTEACEVMRDLNRATTK